MVSKNQKVSVAGKVLSVLLLWCIATASSAQLALKTNVLYDATTTPNLGLEVGLSKRVTAQVFYGLNPWSFKDSNNETRMAKHWLLMPEVRWWQCCKFNGLFYGIHLMGGQFNAQNVNLPLPGGFFKGDNVQKMVRDTRVEGSYFGGGITVGYQWILSRHWNLEVEAGAGYDRVWYDQYPCAECGTRISSGATNYVGLTKLGLSVLYLF